MKITRIFTYQVGSNVFVSGGLFLCAEGLRLVSKSKSRKVRITVSDKRFAGSKLLRSLGWYPCAPCIYYFAIRGRAVFTSRAVRAYLVRKFRDQIRADLQKGELKLYFKIEEVK